MSAYGFRAAPNFINTLKNFKPITENQGDTSIVTRCPSSCLHQCCKQTPRPSFNPVKHHCVPEHSSQILLLLTAAYNNFVSTSFVTPATCASTKTYRQEDKIWLFVSLFILTVLKYGLVQKTMKYHNNSTLPSLLHLRQCIFQICLYMKGSQCLHPYRNC